MKEAIFDWIKNIAYYMILVSAFLHVVPDENYKKYIRLFTGMILILLLSSPVLQLFGVRMDEISFVNMDEYQDKLEEIQETTKYLYDINVSSYVTDENVDHTGINEIEIRKIEIGE